MKGLLALIFSVALIVSQAAFMTETGDFSSQKSETAKCCGHCGNCKGRPCCAAKKDPASHQPAPAVPAHGLSQNDWQLVAAIVLHISPQPPRSITKFFVSLLPRQLPPAAPLYQRHCSA